MRELLLIPIVVSLCVVALFRPRFGMYCYLWFALMRPDVLAWSKGLFPYSMALAVSTFIGFLPQAGSIKRIFSNPITVGLLLMQIPIILSVYNALIFADAWDSYALCLRIMGTSLLIPMLIRSVDQFKTLILVMAVSLGVLGAKFGLFSVINGGVKLNMGYGGMMSDNNNTALAFAMAIPLCWGAIALTNLRWLKALLIFMIGNLLVAIVSTHSRGAAVTMAVILPLIGLCAKRKMIALAAFVIVCGGAIYSVRETYLNRMETLEDPQSETSARSRIYFAQAAIEIWKDHPFLGVGFGGDNARKIQIQYVKIPNLLKWGMRNGSYIHNTYLEYLAGSGIFAAVWYVGLLFGCIWWLQGSIRRVRLTRPDLVIAPRCIQLSLLAFAIGSTFLSRQLFDLFFILVCTTAAWNLLEREGAFSETEEEEEEEEEEPEPVWELSAQAS